MPRRQVFGVTFRTPPEDSTGVPHILEHSVLCGSRKYPVKEPFVDLLKGSLQTFLNAFTYPDRTCYPVASQNLKVCTVARDGFDACCARLVFGGGWGEGSDTHSAAHLVQTVTAGVRAPVGEE